MIQNIDWLVPTKITANASYTKSFNLAILNTQQKITAIAKKFILQKLILNPRWPPKLISKGSSSAVLRNTELRFAEESP